MKKEFKKRTYKNFRQLWSDLKFMSSHRGAIREAMRNGLVSETFRERLMMAVTSVNGCRYCSYFHSREALKSGVSAEELEALTAFEFGECPAEEQPALLYAQHWAETNTQPDEEARNHVLELYGEKRLETIELLLRMIRMGNLMGNTFDLFLFRISFGLLGQ